MIKILFFIFSINYSQNLYNGQIIFDYSGTVNGYFDSIIQDSTLSSILINQENLDSSLIIMGSITEKEENDFDIFLSILQDTIFPIQERIWGIPGQGNDNDPLSLEALTIFIPGIDSSFAIEILNMITDSTNSNDSINIEEYLETIISEFSENIYVGLSGEINFYSVNDTSILGEFNAIMLKPAFHFPPHMISIDNGSIIFNKVTTPSLSIKNNTFFPKNIKINNCYPNPFNSEITIEFFTNHQNLSLSIYDINGKLINTFFSGIIKKGHYSIKWNANQHPSGLYIIKLISKESVKTQKIMFLK